MMEMTAAQGLDREDFARVWRRVIPQDRADCPFTLEEPQTVPPQGIQPVLAAPGPEASGVAVQASVSVAAQGVQTPLCLGEESLPEVPALTRFLAKTLELEKAYLRLGRGKAAPLRREGFTARMAGEKARQAKRLSTAYFLITGQRPEKPETIAPERLPYPLALRACYRAEQRTAAELIGAVRESRDPCLAALYRELGEENQTFAGQIREFLERL